jgi:hypothetical protein
MVTGGLGAGGFRARAGEHGAAPGPRGAGGRLCKVRAVRAPRIRRAYARDNSPAGAASATASVLVCEDPGGRELLRMRAGTGWVIRGVPLWFGVL